MDTSIQNSLFGPQIGKTPYSARSRVSSSGSVRKSAHSFKKISSSGRYSVSARSNQSMQIVVKSEYNIVECYGLQVPVLVNEALTFQERNIVVSINCSTNGWAWAVCSRRLLIWQYKDATTGSSSSELVRTPQRRITTSQCRELTLPHCDIGHKASLVTVFIADGQQMPSCLSISPTGDVRYWPSIAHDGSSIDESGILEGQEFDELISISSMGYILATTTCNLVHLQIQLQSGRHAIVHKAIRPPSGFFGGIGKKFASIIIGMNSNQEKENKLLKICTAPVSSSEWMVSILADRWIQRWTFSSKSGESFQYEDFDILRKIRDGFHQKAWSFKDANEIEVWMLDMQPSESGGLIVLAAGLNISHSPQLHYALVTLAEESDHLIVKKFNVLKHWMSYTPETEAECLKLKFILNRNVCFVYGEKIIYPVYLNGANNNDELEKIEFQSQGDRILFAASFFNIPLFFTRIYGLVCVSPSDFEPGELFNSSIQSDVFTLPNGDKGSNSGDITSIFSPNTTIAENLLMYDLDPEEIIKTNKDTISQLKAAFIYFSKKDTTTCNEILKELFPENITLESDSLLDQVVTSIAQDLAEDIPAADPRWEHEEFTQKQALGSSASLQIIQQLKEKSRVLNLFIDFLHSTKLWNRLTSVSYKGSIKSTCHILSDIYEKIIAAISLKSIHNSHSKLIDESIELVLNEWKQPIYRNLTQQDLFYVKVTQIQDIFRVLANTASDYIQQEASDLHISNLLIGINTVLLAVLREVFRFRESKVQQLSLPADKINQFENLPWTASSGKQGLRDIVLQMINLTLKHGARTTGEPETRQKHYQQLFELIDYLLDGRRCYLESIRDNEKYRVLLQQYESQRTELIYHLLEDEQYELAAKLGEKYNDFQTLVILCDKTKNQARLDGYIQRYKDMDFSQFAIQWHMRQNKKGDLFERFKGNQAALSKFLGDHPSLAWVQHVFNGELDKASQILFMLAQNETELVARKKTMLSLSKLAALASESDLSIQITEINSELFLIEHQEQLSIGVLQQFGYDINNPKVLKTEEIINLYISEENETATEFEFRKALELLSYVEDPLEVRHKIWCAAILKDSWNHYNINSPIDVLQNMIFFKLIDLCFFMDGDIDDFLPPIEDFLHTPDLGNLTEQKSFQFLLKLGFEHIFDTYKKK